jgi:hypothetical protein
VQLTPDDIKEFQSIWKEVFGETISEADARDCGNRLIELYLLFGKLTAGSDSPEHSTTP